MPRPIHFTGLFMLACGMALCVSVSAQGETGDPLVSANYFVQSWQTDEGLPANAVNDVLQDQQGFIWLATIGGLVRFDGVSFKPFTSPLIARVAARNLRALAKTGDSTLLMLPAVGGVVRLKNGQFSSHPIGEGLVGRQMQTLFADPGGAIWVGMYGGGIRRWKDGKVADFNPADGLSTRARSSFAADKEGRTWVASGDFLGGYSGETLTPPNPYRLDWDGGADGLDCNIKSCGSAPTHAVGLRG